MPDNSIDSKVESVGVVDPKEATAVETSIKGKEQGPRAVDQTGTFVDWQAARDELGSPYDADRLPLRKRYQMSRDPMLAFGLHYRKVPLVRAQFHMEARDKNGPNAQIAAFMDSAWRPIHADYCFKHTLDFNFGSAQLIRRFVTGNPGGVWRDDTETDPTKRLKPVWDEGTVEPIIWKPFINLPLEKVVPNFDDATGDFAGMIFDSSASQAAPITAPKDAHSLTNTQTLIDVYHALWTTNEKASVFGNIYGFPLLAYAYRYWWSYWFRWANADRAFERMAVPPLIARHPEGDYVDAEGNTRPFSEISAEAALALRSNSVATVPSTLQTAGIEEAGSNTPMWDFDYMETSGINFEFLDKSFNYLDVMKLRSIWVPEQAFIEGEGGTWSRNVASLMGLIFNQSQANKWEEIAFVINRYIIPQLLLVNFPEFVNNGGTCRIIGHGFDSEDQEVSAQITQLLGQNNGLTDVDVRTMLERKGIPLKSPEQLAQEQVDLANNQLTANRGVPGVSGVTRAANPGDVASAQAGNPGGNAGGSIPQSSATGFSDQPLYVYYNQPDQIELTDTDDFLTSLPQTIHYSDKSMRAIALQIRKLFQGHFRQLYPDFAKYVASVKTIVLTDDDDGENLALNFAEEIPPGSIMLFATKRDITKSGAKKAAVKLINGWQIESTRLKRLTDSSEKLLTRGLKRSLSLAEKATKPEQPTSDEMITDYVKNKTGTLITGVTKTMKNELQAFLVNEILEGNSAETIGQNITDHFEGFEEYKADRIARSEVRDVMNAGSLFNAEAAKLKYVQATDGTDFDVECRNRNGKLYTIREAWKEMSHAKTHSNCTLGFKPIARADFSIASVDKLPAEAGEALAWYDDKTCTAYVPFNLSDELTTEFLTAVGNELVVQNA